VGVSRKLRAAENLSAARSLKAEDGVRTRDPQLGKLMLCQLSYFRVRFLFAQHQLTAERCPPSLLLTAVILIIIHDIWRDTQQSTVQEKARIIREHGAMKSVWVVDCAVVVLEALELLD
jgi:hypothetical protein